jgi:hypothetical protein
MTVWSIGILQSSLFFFFLYDSFPVFFLRIILYFTILIPFYNFVVVVVTVHTFSYTYTTADVHTSVRTSRW